MVQNTAKSSSKFKFRTFAKKFIQTASETPNELVKRTLAPHPLIGAVRFYADAATFLLPLPTPSSPRTPMPNNCLLYTRHLASETLSKHAHASSNTHILDSWLQSLPRRSLKAHPCMQQHTFTRQLASVSPSRPAQAWSNTRIPNSWLQNLPRGPPKEHSGSLPLIGRVGNTLAPYQW